MQFFWKYAILIIWKSKNNYFSAKKRGAQQPTKGSKSEDASYKSEDADADGGDPYDDEDADADAVGGDTYDGDHDDSGVVMVVMMMMKMIMSSQLASLQLQSWGKWLWS